jgi:hypothetical protein
MFDKKKTIEARENKRSSLSEFIERPLPSPAEVAAFDKKVKQNSRPESGDEISDELLEIYEDANGNIIDVKKINIKKRHLFWPVLRTILFLALIAGVLYGAYYYFIKNPRSRADLLDITIEAPKNIVAGEEFFYNLNYRNLASTNLQNIKIEITYPENFIYIDSLPNPLQNKNTWEIANLDKGGAGTIKIKGKLINKDGSDNLLLVNARYYLAGFSTEFQKETSALTSIKGLGFNADFNFASTALIGDENEIAVVFNNYKTAPTAVSLVAAVPSNMAIVDIIGAKDDAKALAAEKITDDTWEITGFDQTQISQELKVKYRVAEKTADKQTITLRFEQKAENDQSYTFLEKAVELEIIKSNLNLGLSINSNKGDQPVNFEDTLNYNLTYSNEGDAPMKDLVLMAVIDGNFVDWSTLKDKYHGSRKNNVITWTKNEIPELKELAPQAVGQIDFSIKVIPFRQSDLGQNFQLTSYVQFSIGNSEELKEGSDNKSNTIVTKINSNLSFKEEIRYFDTDNVPVGAGPLPPRVGEKTSLKVYWSLRNDLHELNDLRVEYNLPSGVAFNNNAKTSVGDINYDSESNKIIWNIGRLPLSVYQAAAELNIAITPGEDDRNKIMVISNGSTAQAIDNETQATIFRGTNPQTTKLDDDDIAGLSSDGRVQ